MKKILAAVILLFCSFTLYAGSSQGETGIELQCGYSFAALANFNENFRDIYKTGFNSNVDAYPIPGLLLADIKFRYSIAEGLPAYLRMGFTRMEDSEILHDTASDTDVATSTGNFNVTYLGVGIKYGFRISKSFSFFLGADGGCFIPVDSYWTVVGNPASPLVNTDVSDPGYNANQRIDFKDSFFGGNAGAGVEWAMSDGMGIIIEGGYKIAKTSVAYTGTGVFARNGFDFTELDLSGPYASAGLVLYYGGKGAGKDALSAEKESGNYYFWRKDYKEALKRYSAEYKIKPSSRTYKDIGLCYYYLGMNDKAIYVFERYIKMNPADKDAAAFLKKLKK